MTSEIIYALVAKEKTQVLCEATPSDKKGNFETIACEILSKIIENSQAAVEFQNGYVFYYLNKQGITGLCLCKASFPKSAAYLFLEEIVGALFDKFTKSEIEKEKAYSKVFSDIYSPILNEKLMKFNKSKINKDTINLADENVEVGETFRSSEILKEDITLVVVDSNINKEENQEATAFNANNQVR